jgi:seryl-tRNA synthetase
VAKKRKTSRKPASRKKKTAAKRKPASTRSVKMKGTRLDLRPLKKNIKKHIDALKAAKRPEGKVQEAIDTLTRSLQELNDECLPTMELELGEASQ